MNPAFREQRTCAQGWVLFYASNELVDPVETLLDIRHAGRLADSKVIIRSERNSRHSRYLFRFQQFRAKLRRLQASLGNVREQVKRALRVDAGNSRNAIELLPRELTAFRKFCQ